MLLKDKLTEVLNQTTGERKVHDFLKKEPYLIWATFMSTGGHSNYVIPEFSLAGKYRPDFVIMQSFSGGWNVEFIELEPVDEKPFNQDGSPSKRLRGAIKQVDDWKNFEYSIVMGRRSDFNEQLIHEKSKFFRNHKIKILTYDRLIEVAENLDQPNRLYKSRTINKKDKFFLHRFAENPKQFSISSNQDAQQILRNLEVNETCYSIQVNERETGFVVDVLNTNYEIFEDRLRFQLNRVEPDGLASLVADDLESLEAAIKLAEIFERLMQFPIQTEHSLDLVDECLQFLKQNPPRKVVN